MSETPDEIDQAMSPFLSLFKILEPLGLDPEQPLRDFAPGLWPTWGDLTRLVGALADQSGERAAIVAWLREAVRAYPTHPLIAFVGDPFSQDAEIMCERIAEAINAEMHRLPRNASNGT